MVAPGDKAVWEFLRETQNPYAVLEWNDAIFEEVTASPAASPSSHSRARKNNGVTAQPDLFDQAIAVPPIPGATLDQFHGNPYARLSSADADQSECSEESSEASQATFRTSCRRIFGFYMPRLERGRLRAEYRDFISRNETRSPRARYKLLELLKRYDLSDLPEMQPQFNREDDRLTAAKLFELERSVGTDD